MCGECCNFELFAIILIVLSPLFFFSKTKIRIENKNEGGHFNKSIFFEFIYTYYFFFFNFRVGTCPPWSYTGSASAFMYL
jgi:hypothetical protein